MIPVTAIFSYAVVKSGFDLISCGTLVLRLEIEPQRFGAGYALFVQYIIVSILISLVWLVVGAWCLNLLFGYDRRAPRIFIGLMVLAIISRAWDFSFAYRIDLLMLPRDYSMIHATTPVVTVSIVNITACIVGICYVLISKRVKNTFRFDKG